MSKGNREKGYWYLFNRGENISSQTHKTEL